MLAHLCDLDPGKRADRAAHGCQAEPCRLGVAEPAEPAEEKSAFGEHSGFGPGCVPAARFRRVPGIAGRVAAGPPAEVGRAPRRPPRFVIRARFADREARSLGGEQLVFACTPPGRGGRPRRQRGIDAVERRLVPALPGERTREPGEVAGRCVAPALHIGVAAIDVDEETRK
jgi:hypothetical protein